MERAISVDSKCIHCGMCVKDCPMSCIELDGGRVPAFIDGGENLCMACQHCMSICPVGALSFGGKSPDDSEIVKFANHDDLIAMMKSRRSVRHYKDADIPPEKIAKLTDILGYAPRGGNVDALHFSIVGTRAKMDEIRRTANDAILKLETDNPLIQFVKAKVKSGQDIIFCGAPSMIAAAVDKSKAVAGCETVDPIIALSYFELCASSLGLGTLWDDAAVFVLANFPEVYSLMEIPEGYTLSFVMLVGIPAVKYRRTPQREAASVKILQ